MKMFFRRRCYRTYESNKINKNELIEKINQGAILLDVRSIQEYNEGHLNGAINIPEHEIERTVEQIIPKKNQLIVIYCQCGSRSIKAYNKMRNKGYTNIYELTGGLNALI